jgi:hypothetical protein
MSAVQPSAAQPAADQKAQVLDVAEAEKALSLPQMLKVIAERYGKPFQSVVADIARAAFSKGKIGTEEYFTLRLFDDKSLKSERSAFAGMHGMRDVWCAANTSSHWFGPMSDKLAFDTLLGGYGLPVIETKAYFSTGLKVRAKKMLESRKDLRAFITDPASYPYFAKPRSSSLSLGSASAVSYDAVTDKVMLLNGKSMPVEAFIDDILKHFSDGYLFQERLTPHQGVRAICGDRTATVRIYTINGEAGPKVFRIVWKIPAGKNMADNFWRKGNILAAIDYETGRITRAVTGVALDQKELQVHPDTGHQLVGTEIPAFKSVVQLALDGARIFSDIPLIGWDIAPTDNGGTIVEGNFAPDFKLVQMAEARGILDSELSEFLAWCKERQRTQKLEARRRIKEFTRDDMKKFMRSARKVA